MTTSTVLSNIAPTATLTAAVYERLRRDIVSGALAPGERLRIDLLRQRYQVGASPLREALNRLSAEQLVSQEAQRGFQVSQVSIDELMELTRTRCWINEIALRESIANGNQAWEEAIVIAFHRLSRLPMPTADDAENYRQQWERQHRAFHSSLIAGCRSRWLTDFAEMLFDRADRYRYLAGLILNVARDIPQEHRLIMEATIDRDAPRAIALLNDHAIKTADAIKQEAGARLENGSSSKSASMI